MGTLSGGVALSFTHLLPFSRVYSERNKIAPLGKKCFPLRVNRSLEEIWQVGKQSGSHGSCSP